MKVIFNFNLVALGLSVVTVASNKFSVSNRHLPRVAAGIGLLLSLMGCAAGQVPVAPPSPAPVTDKPLACSEAKDRQAILAMAGSYRVSFDFEETEVLTPGYAPHAPLKTGATELVLVLGTAPGHVSLQHVLVVGGGVTKHWRQDWAFEDRELLEFQGQNTWTEREVSADEARCTWTQAVFEVDDSPRYEGIGRWAHEAQGSVWQSNETWRPLPRREYTKRSDYDVLLGFNRHRITSTGWEHEQANVKVVLTPHHSLVRERGLNRYTRIDADATQEAADYFQATAAFWQQVREEWARVLAPRKTLRLSKEVAGRRLYEPLFERAQARAEPGANGEFIHETIAQYLLGSSDPSASLPALEPSIQAWRSE